VLFAGDVGLNTYCESGSNHFRKAKKKILNRSKGSGGRTIHEASQTRGVFGSTRNGVLSQKKNQAKKKA